MMGLPRISTLLREAVAGGWLCFEHIPATTNPTDVLTEPLLQFSLKTFVEPLLMWKGDTVDATPGDPDMKGSDTDLGHKLSRVTNQSCMVTSNHARRTMCHMRTLQLACKSLLHCPTISAVSCLKKMISVNTLQEQF